MKNIFIISVITVAINSCDTNASGDANLPESVAISVVLDVTDKRIYLPAADDVLRLFDCQKAPDASYLFRLRSITDKRLTPIESILLSDARNMEKDNKDDDPQFRNKSILSFYTAVRYRMKEFYTKTGTIKSLDNSECFRAVAGELAFLASVNIKRRILLIASDLIEKSDIWDFYSALPASPEVLAKKIEGTSLLPPNMKNIEVVFLFNPTDREEDKTFSLIAEGYKLALETKGAKVSIQASL